MRILGSNSLCPYRFLVQTMIAPHIRLFGSWYSGGMPALDGYTSMPAISPGLATSSNSAPGARMPSTHTMGWQPRSKIRLPAPVEEMLAPDTVLTISLR